MPTDRECEQGDISVIGEGLANDGHPQVFVEQHRASSGIEGLGLDPECVLSMGTSSTRWAMEMKVDHAASITLGSPTSSFSHSESHPSCPRRL